jgi:putative hydrolase of the HAD superfamily
MAQTSPAGLADVEAVSLDFFNTLIFHREGPGRGRALIHYLDAHGFAHAPWEHQVLYDVFAEHDARYSPEAPPAERAAYYVFLASRVFERLEVSTANDDAARHAASLWRILGPGCFDVFPDAWIALSALRAKGYPTVVVSNWQCGLRHYCTELGLSSQVDHIVGSADVGAAKPDRAIFAEACTRLGKAPERVVHVGDSLPEDYRGGGAAGLQVILLQREPGPRPGGELVIHTLAELPPLLEAG